MTDETLFYYGTDFWMLNDELCDEEIERQLTEMKRQGVYSFIARTYIGIISDYPGVRFKSSLRKIVDTAKQFGMKVFLQAGYMPEHVPGLPKQQRLRYLTVNEGDDLCRYGNFCFGTATSDSFLDMFSKSTVSNYLKICYEDMWQEFADEYGKTILSIWVDEPSYSAKFLPYPEGIEEQFRARWGYSLNEKVYTLFLDVEDYESVRYHYRKLLQDMLEESYFVQLRAWCQQHGLMASGHLMMEDTLKSQISRAGACMPYYPYFDMPGIDILSAQINWRDNEIKSRVYYEGNTVMRKMVFPQYMTTPIQCCSVSRQLGIQHTLCEMYGVVSQDMTFRNQRYLFDYMAAHGINHRSVHGIFYSLRGRRKRAYPPHFNYYQPYWNENGKMYHYVANVSRFISQGRNEADALVIHPLSTAYCEYTNAEMARVCGVQPSDLVLERRDRAFLKMMTDLSFANVRFDLGDERLIEQHGKVIGDTFTVGQMDYKTVILPDLKTIQSSTLALLESFIKNGGQVIVAGDVPYMVDGFCQSVFDDESSILRLENGDIGKIVQAVENPAYAIKGHDSPGVLIRRRVEGDKSFYFLFNVDAGESKDIELTIYDAVSVSVYDGYADTVTPCGCRHANGNTEVALCVPPGGSLMLICQVDGGNSCEPTLKTENVLCELENCWQCTCDTLNVLLLEFCRYKKGEQSYSREYPTLAVQEILTKENYEGEVSLAYTFTSEEELELIVAMENVEQQRIALNGENVDNTPSGYYLSTDFKTVRLPKCKKGVNVLEVSRFFTPLKRAKQSIGSLFTTEDGTELESLYLLGDFSVNTVKEFETNGNLRFHKNMTLAPRRETVSHELTESGYPFYAGRVELTQEFELAQTESVVLQADSFCGAVANVYVNNIYCGDLHCPPYRLDISKALKVGQNSISIGIYNTLRNLLGPYHRPYGEVGNLFLDGYDGIDGSWTGNPNYDPRWYEHRYPDTPFWTESYMQVRFGIKNIKLLTIRDKAND